MCFIIGLEGILSVLAHGMVIAAAIVVASVLLAVLCCAIGCIFNGVLVAVRFLMFSAAEALGKLLVIASAFCVGIGMTYILFLLVFHIVNYFGGYGHVLIIDWVI